ncbi:MAG: hypothetical protein FWH08_06405 [Oscillospiraceae bacterium]|nr:hypothetical protein [Oscillospiraceae bacterium]
MNKHDFYKEIMAQYTFDEEKIRRNAKRAPSTAFLMRNSKWLPLTTAAAVFVAVFGGYMLFANPDNGRFEPPPTVIGAGASHKDRMDDIILFEEMLLSHSSSLQGNIFISFSKPLTYKEFDSILNLVASDTGYIEVKSLWNGEFVDAEVAAEQQLYLGSDVFYSGAKVWASVDGSLYSALSERPEFSAVEREGRVNENNFEPLITNASPEDVYTPATVIPPDETTAGVSNNIETPATVLLSDDEVPDAADVEISDVTTGDTENPDDVLQEDIILEIEAENVKFAEFISENNLVLLTKDQIMLYQVDLLLAYDNDERNEQADVYTCNIVKSFDAANPKVIFTDTETGTLLITATDYFGRQTRLFIVDGIKEELVELNTSNITQGFTDVEINYAFYSNGEIVLKAQNAYYQAIYLARVNDYYNFNGFEKFAESQNKLIILNHDGKGFFYVREFEDGTFRVNRHFTADNSEEELDLQGLGIGGQLKFERSPDAKNFAVITESGTYIWNNQLSALTDNTADISQVKFHRYSGNIFSDGANRYFMLYGNEIVSVTESEAEALALAEKPVFSSSYRLYEITAETVSIEIIL